MHQVIHFVVFLLLLATFSGCSSSQSLDDTSTARKAFESAPGVERLIIQSANVRIEVARPQVAAEDIKAIIQREAGYIDYANVSDQQWVSLTARIPQARLESVVNEIATKGKLLARSINSQDVTEEMIDVGARLKNLQVLRERFRALLSKAEKVSEVIEIERELARIQSEMDSIEGRIKSLKSQLTYSQLDITLKKKTTYGPLGYVFKGLFWGIKKLFVIQ